MRSHPAADQPGYFHETAFYGSDDELLAIVVPFLEEGVAAGEPTLVTFNARNAALVRDALPDTTGIEFHPGADQYARPAATIRAYRRTLAQHVAAGASQIRVVGDVPHPGTGMSWDAWARYEAVVNHAYDDFPIWGMCPYDTRITPDEVLLEVERTHPHVATPDGRHLPNPAFEDPREFLAARAPRFDDPLCTTAPALVVDDPDGSTVRAQVAALARERSALATAEVDDLLVAMSEVVTNASMHGAPPVRLRAWIANDRVVVRVDDAGDGDVDPFAGLIPKTPSERGGLGLWIAHQLCADVVMARTDDGFSVTLVAGHPFVP